MNVPTPFNAPLLDRHEEGPNPPRQMWGRCASAGTVLFSGPALLSRSTPCLEAAELDDHPWGRVSGFLEGRNSCGRESSLSTMAHVGNRDPHLYRQACMLYVGFGVRREVYIGPDTGSLCSPACRRGAVHIPRSSAYLSRSYTLARWHLRIGLYL